MECETRSESGSETERNIVDDKNKLIHIHLDVMTEINNLF